MWMINQSSLHNEVLVKTLDNKAWVNFPGVSWLEIFLFYCHMLLSCCIMSPQGGDNISFMLETSLSSPNSALCAPSLCYFYLYPFPIISIIISITDLNKLCASF